MDHLTATSETAILGTFAATLFALLNPLGMLPVFIGYTAGMRRGVQRWLAIFVSITVLGLMLLFLFAGTVLLNFFGSASGPFCLNSPIRSIAIGPSPHVCAKLRRSSAGTSSRRSIGNGPLSVM